MKAFDEMTPQRQTAHELFDQLLDLRMEAIRRLVSPGFHPSQLLKLDEVLQEQEALVDGAKEIVCLAEIVGEATELALQTRQEANPPEAATKKTQWPPPTKT